MSLYHNLSVEAKTMGNSANTDSIVQESDESHTLVTNKQTLYLIKISIKGFKFEKFPTVFTAHYAAPPRSVCGGQAQYVD